MNSILIVPIDLDKYFLVVISICISSRDRCSEINSFKLSKNNHLVRWKEEWGIVSKLFWILLLGGFVEDSEGAKCDIYTS